MSETGKGVTLRTGGAVAKTGSTGSGAEGNRAEPRVPGSPVGVVPTVLPIGFGRAAGVQGLQIVFASWRVVW
jgi:hypothetical protein